MSLWTWIKGKSTSSKTNDRGKISFVDNEMNEYRDLFQQQGINLGIIKFEDCESMSLSPKVAAKSIELLEKRKNEILRMSPDVRRDAFIRLITKNFDSSFLNFVEAKVDLIDPKTQDIVKEDQNVGSAFLKVAYPAAAAAQNWKPLNESEAMILAAFWPLNDLEQAIDCASSEWLEIDDSHWVYLPAKFQIFPGSDQLDLDPSPYNFSVFSSPRRFLMFVGSKNLKDEHVLFKIKFRDITRYLPPLDFFQLNPLGFFTRCFSGKNLLETKFKFVHAGETGV